MGFNDVLDNRQSQTAASRIPRTAFVDAIKTLKNPGQVLFRHAQPIVGNLDQDLLFHVVTTDLGGAFFLAVPQAIGDQVCDHLFDFTGIALNIDFTPPVFHKHHANVCAFGAGFELVHDLTDQVAQVKCGNVQFQ